jgi:hypothetical protein
MTNLRNYIDIPKVAAPEPAGSDPPYVITELTTMSDLSALNFCIWTSDNRAIRTVDLTAVERDGSEIQTYPIDQAQTFVALGRSP